MSLHLEVNTSLLGADNNCFLRICGQKKLKSEARSKLFFDQSSGFQKLIAISFDCKTKRRKQKLGFPSQKY